MINTVNKNQKQITKLPFAISLEVGSSLENETGSQRIERPVYAYNLLPCNKACPAGEYCQEWLFYAEEGRYQQAREITIRNSPLPAVMGRVCYHPYQTVCNRGEIDEAVGINSIERSVGDKTLEEGWKVELLTPDTDKRVLMVRAGPSGLPVMHRLHRAGHEALVREAGPMAGDMMRSGIPSYRLPRGVLDQEAARIAVMGVRFEYGAKVMDVAVAATESDAVFLTIGAQMGRHADIPVGDSAKVLDAVDVLARMRSVEKPQLGRRIIVYGGGNTAVDTARTAKRLGAEEAIIVYRRTRNRTPAHDSEIMGVEEEGVTMKRLSTTKHVDGGEIKTEKMISDESGFPVGTGGYEDLGADTVIMALGQEADLGLVVGVPGIEVGHGVVRIDAQMMIRMPGVFVGGDMAPSQHTATTATGHGKLAARCIDVYLRSEIYESVPAAPDAKLGFMNAWYYTDAPRRIRGKLVGVRRVSSFDEVVQGLDEESAVFEVRRCMSCGNCFGCDNCFGVRLDNAIKKIKPTQYVLKCDYCKGCGICAERCPCGAIDMVLEANRFFHKAMTGMANRGRFLTFSLCDCAVM